MDTLRERLDKANELKLEGNESFKATKWNEALVSYRTALGHLPPRHPPAEPGSDQADLDSPGPTTEPDVASMSDGVDVLDAECAKVRAVLHANIAACLLKLVSRARLSASQAHPSNRAGRPQRRGRCMFSRQVHIAVTIVNPLSRRSQLSAMTHTTSRHFREGQHRTRRLVHGHP